MTRMLEREEYIEQAYFFRTFLERLDENLPSQEILENIREEILTTTRLPLAIDVLKGELLLKGRLSPGMAYLSHYFAPFQTFVIQQSEEDRAKFDQRIALQILEREASYRAESPQPAGLFIYQFECISRNRLGYDKGLRAIAEDPLYNADWKDWILKVARVLGTVDFTDLIYSFSAFAEEERLKDHPDAGPPRHVVLFSRQEGRIAKANRGKDPLYLFAALQRQLGYPAVPRFRPSDHALQLHPQLELRLVRMEKRLQLLEAEAKGKLDLSQFYVQEPKFGNDGLESR